MARDVADANFYVASGGKVPAKWTAPEVHIGATQYLLMYKIRKFNTAIVNDPNEYRRCVCVCVCA